MVKRLISVKYATDDPCTDFQYLMNKQPSNTLFLYNENVEQFLDKNDLRPGGGNGIMRKYRLDSSRTTTVKNSGSLGIPTMFLQHKITDDTLFILVGYIHNAFGQIHNILINNPNIHTIIWSAEKNLNIGLSIAIRSGHLSKEHAHIVQNAIRENMLTIIREHSLQCCNYDNMSDSLSTDEFLNIMEISSL